MFGSFLDKAKGQALSMAGRKILGSYLEKYGEMLDFSVQPDTKTITLEVLLKGEQSPIKIVLDGYELLEPTAPNGKPALRVTRATASREWMQVLLGQYLEGKPIELPPQAAPLLKLLI